MGILLSTLTGYDGFDGSDDSQDGVEPHTSHRRSTERDVKEVQEILLDFLPLELINMILDEAEYWPVLICRNVSSPAKEIAARAYPEHCAKYCYYISPKLPNTIRPKKVTFILRSRDQGWGGDPGVTGTYPGSWTWFEAAIFRGLDAFIEDADRTARRVKGSEMPPRSPSDSSETQPPIEGAVQIEHPCNGSNLWMLQRNRRANRGEAQHEITWTSIDDVETKEDTDEALDRSGSGGGYGFVCSLQPGDRIAVYARAQYPGWVNHVHGVEIQIYYSL
ncbi:hypothetical protein DFP72DRAFT_76792 [Ephemerocybe angulata]|uniref:Uncharacterized protein n=1 Tax=Ephemerocybe angulata TaxID=980116 RepID=A0A8H6I809_9AGAR|nr:hypothetical protein DFP72DRAFT_76792 [Tulosesus angulatus]